MGYVLKYRAARPYHNYLRVTPPPKEPAREKTNNLGSDQVRHKAGCTVTEDG